MKCNAINIISFFKINNKWYNHIGYKFNLIVALKKRGNSYE